MPDSKDPKQDPKQGKKPSSKASVRKEANIFEEIEEIEQDIRRVESKLDKLSIAFSNFSTACEPIFALVEEVSETRELCSQILSSCLHTQQVCEQILTQLLPPPPPPVRTAHLRFIFEGDPNMSASLQPGQTKAFTLVGLDAAGKPTGATLANLVLTSSDILGATVALDPATPNGGIVTALTPATMPDAVLITAVADATDPDGTVTTGVTGTDTVTVGVPPPPPPPPVRTASLGFVWAP